MDFYTADLYYILMSDHDDNFCKYNKTIVTDYSFKPKTQPSLNCVQSNYSHNL